MAKYAAYDEISIYGIGDTPEEAIYEATNAVYPNDAEYGFKTSRHKTNNI